MITQLFRDLFISFACESAQDLLSVSEIRLNLEQGQVEIEAPDEDVQSLLMRLAYIDLLDAANQAIARMGIESSIKKIRLTGPDERFVMGVKSESRKGFFCRNVCALEQQFDG